MFPVSLITIAVLVFLSPATSTLLCYDCDGGTECEDPVRHNVRTVNCISQYPNAPQEGQLVCLLLDITVPSIGSRGFNMFKSGQYRGCRVIPNGEETNYCDNLSVKYSDRLNINSCRYCNTTRCIP